MSDLPIAQFNLNIPQARALMVMTKEMWIFAGRGSGKTQGISAPWAMHKVQNLPRSTGGIIGQSFKDLETKILQPLFLGWEMMGLEKDIHYIHGKKPPADWGRPLTPVLDHEYIISFPNGSNIELISLHNKGSANSKSLQWIFGPEAKFFKPDQLRQEVFPILRGHVKHFGKSPWYGAKLFETDKYAPNIDWLLDKRKLHNEKVISTIIFFQLQLNELALQLATASKSHAYKLKEKYDRINNALSELRKKAVYVGEFSAKDNIENLGEDWLRDRKQDLSEYEYKIAILNEDPTRVENGFYPDRTEEHLYNKADDDDIMKPIAVALDYQASISPWVGCQVNDRVIPGELTLNFLHSLYVKYPFGLKDVVDKFCLLHKHRPCKVVYYYHDQTAVAPRNMHKSYRDEVKEFFENNGWRVVLMYSGAAPNHDIKYNAFKTIFQNKTGLAYRVRYHRENCASLLLSMDMSGTKESDKGTRKDKSKEADKLFPQEKSTHLSDTGDMLLWPIVKLGTYPLSDDSDGEVRFS